jgi:hypothetical protein
MIAKEMAGKLVPEGLMKSARGASGGAKTIRKQAAESAAPERMMISKRVVARVAPEILLMKTKGESPASKMIQKAAVASLNREKMMSRMGAVGVAVLPRKKTIPKVPAESLVPETTAMKAKSAEVASKKKQKAVVVNLVPERTMIKKAVVVSLVLETMAMKAKGASLASNKIRKAAVASLLPEIPTTQPAGAKVAKTMMIRKAMAESKVAWVGVFKTQVRATTLRPWTMAPWRTS